jgi:long-chain acyl-CoA synthetase
VDQLVNKVAPEFDTMLKTYEYAADHYADLPCLGTRLPKSDGTYDTKFTYESYKTVRERRNRIGAGIRTLLGRDDKYIVGLYSANRAEWVITMLATQAFDLIYTALYDTLGPSTSAYILNFTEAPIIVVARNKLSTILQLKKNDGLPHLKFVVTMEPLHLAQDFGLIQLAESRGVRLLDFNQLERIGISNPLPIIHPAPDTTYGISFTSGTTGNPKGVEITQRMTAAFVAFSLGSVSCEAPQNEQTRVFSFLPLAHIYEVSNLSMQLTQGCSIAFPPDPSPLKLGENLGIVKPHLVALVPRIYTKMEAALKDKMSNSVIGRQVLKGIESKIERSTDDELSHSLLLDSVFLNGVRKKLGVDKTFTLISGSAPIGAETVNFIRAVLGTGFSQGYGLTESTSGVFIASPFEKEITCGGVGVTSEFRLRSLPEMNYHTHDEQGNELDEPQGELLLRGSQIFPRYFKNPEATNEAFDSEGWFKTGDVAKLDHRGRILIIDRVKNFFKLAQGEYITPERIENTYLSVCSFLTQLYVHGDSMKTYLVAIAGVDPDAFKSHLSHYRKTHELSKLNIDDILRRVNASPDLKRLVLLEMDGYVKHEGLHGFEKLHNVELMVEPLKISDETITPTLKIKRNVASRFFKDSFEQLYSEGSLLKSNKL